MPELLAEARRSRRAAGSDCRVAVPPVRRRTSLVHRQHHLPRPRLAQARRAGAVRVATVDAERLVIDGAPVRIITERGEATIEVAVDDRMHPGHLACPTAPAPTASSTANGWPTAWRRTPSPARSTATASPGRRGTRRYPPDSNPSPHHEPHTGDGTTDRAEPLPDVDIPDTSVTDYTFRTAPDDAERVAIIDGVDGTVWTRGRRARSRATPRRRPPRTGHLDRQHGGADRRQQPAVPDRVPRSP